MSCGGATEIDWAGFAADPRAPEWEGFRAHYPTCADCSRVVASWTHLRGALAEAGGIDAAHPADAELLAFASEPSSLARARRAALEAHLAGCAPCRTELAVLRRFDFSALGAGAPQRARSVAARPGPGERLRALAEALLGPLRQPAFAWAAWALLAIPIGVAMWLFLAVPETREAPPIAHDEPSRVAPPPPFETPVPRELAHETVPAPASQPAPTVDPIHRGREPVVAQQQPAPEVIAKARPAPPLPPAPDLTPPPDDEPLDLASLLPETAPAYRPQLVLAGGTFAPARTDSVMRGAGKALPEARPLAPEHVGATLDASPTLYWVVFANSDTPVELTVIDEQRTEPLLELRVEPPVAAGLHALRLADHGVQLAPDTTYQFYVALIPDLRHRDLDRVAGAALRYTPAAADLERRLAEGGPAHRGHVLAESGYWIDAFDAITRIADAHPESARAAVQRAALLEQVGQADVAAALAHATR